LITGSTSSNDGDVTGNHDPFNFHTDYWVVKLAPFSVGVHSLPMQPDIFTANFSGSGILVINFFSEKLSDLRVGVHDITGRILYQTQISAMAGTNKKEIDVGDLAKGIYIVTLSGAEASTSVKVIKQ